MQVQVTDPGGNMTPLPEKEPTTTSAHDGMSGGQMVLSGNYYF